MRRHALLTSSLWAALLAAAAPAQADVSGVLSIERRRTRRVAGRAVQDATLDLHLHLRERVVRRAPDATEVVRATITAVRGAVRAKMVGIATPRMSFDSRRPEGGPLAALAGLVDRSFTYRRTPSGSVQDLRGGDALRDALARAAEETPGAAVGVDAMVRRLGEVLRDEVLAAQLELLRRPPPAGAAEDTGARVVRSDPLPDLGRLTYSLRVRRRGRRVELTQEGTPRLSADPAAAGEGAKDLRVKAVAVSGDATLGSDGRVIRAVLRRRVDGSARAFLGARLKLEAAATLRWKEVSRDQDRAGRRSF